MRIVVTGASGNVGTSVLEALARDDAVESIVGVARRVPELALPKTSWRAADVASDDLRPIFEGADCEDWPTEGIPSAYYARQKAEVERRLDLFELEAPDVRVVRLRPALIFKRGAASEIRRLFVGPLLPSPLVRRSLIPLVPEVDRLVFQAVHSSDVGEAYRLAATGNARGAFNIAAEPVLDPRTLADMLDAKLVPVQAGALRALADISWRLHLQPSAPGWLDMARAVPVMDTARARNELGWAPKHGADEALLELLGGIRDGADFPTPPLARRSGGPLRVKELVTGIGSRP